MSNVQLNIENCALNIPGKHAQHFTRNATSRSEEQWGTAAARLPSIRSGPEPVKGSSPKSDSRASPRPPSARLAPPPSPSPIKWGRDGWGGRRTFMNHAGLSFLSFRSCLAVMKQIQPESKVIPLLLSLLSATANRAIDAWKFSESPRTTYCLNPHYSCRFVVPPTHPSPHTDTMEEGEGGGARQARSEGRRSGVQSSENLELRTFPLSPFASNSEPRTQNFFARLARPAFLACLALHVPLSYESPRLGDTYFVGIVVFPVFPYRG